MKKTEQKDLFLYRLPDLLSKRDGENLYNDLQKYMGIRETYEVGTNTYREYLQAITPEEEVQNFVTERPLSDNEKKKKEEIVKALKRDHSNWEKSKIYAIATATAKKWATRRKRWKDPWDPKKPRKLKRKKYSEHVVT